jgi:DNA-directed RNA polymerase subunit M/transcription elongation factor TFIIS
MAEQLRRCSKCQQDKPPSAFCRAEFGTDGLSRVCRLCRKAQNAAYHRREQVKKRQKERSLNYERSAEVKARRLQKRLRERALGIDQARHRVNYAVQEGRLPRVKTLPCAKCGNPAQHYHHHRGYAREHQLHVIPLCAPCHYEAEHKSTHRKEFSCG